MSKGHFGSSATSTSFTFLLIFHIQGKPINEVINGPKKKIGCITRVGSKFMNFKRDIMTNIAFAPEELFYLIKHPNVRTVNDCIKH